MIGGAVENPVSLVSCVGVRCFTCCFKLESRGTPLPPRFFRVRRWGWVFMWDFRQGLSRFFNGLDVEIECVRSSEGRWRILDAHFCLEYGCF